MVVQVMTLLVNSVQGSRHINNWQPISQNNLESLIPVIEFWVHECDSHVLCQKAISGQRLDEERGVALPSRLLDIKSGSELSVDSIKLIESRGTLGKYCALSYCWGPPEKHPPKTLRSNLKERKTEILVTSLPRVFQQAVSLARAIGFDYLWIDSFCIIQDDVDGADWNRESHRMGKVFENASLVIAAAGVKDPSGSLFDMPRYPHLTFSMKHTDLGIGPTNFPEEYMDVTCRSHLEGSPMSGSLGKRAWAFQEWRLARRILSFMPRGMSWHCKTHALDEQGPIEDFSSNRWLEHLDYTSLSSWQKNLHEYTDSELTFISDRLPAIQGLADNFARGLGQSYRLGVFSKDLAQQLIWIHNGKQSSPRSRSPDLPSWCWASLEGEKFFLNSLVVDGLRFARTVAISSVSLPSEDKTLVVGGGLYLGSVSQSVFAAGFLHSLQGRNWNLEYLGLKLSGWFSIFSDANESNVWGFAMFDLADEWTATVHILPMVESPRHTFDP